jgi:DNA-3-methyladenine glycosylase
MKKVPLEFYLRKEVLQLSKELLGKVLCTRSAEGIVTSGMIVEVEAYKAPEDKASHAYGNLRSARTETLFSQGGVCYIYLCYGMHHLFNVVTNNEGIPHAILIRALEPLQGIELMKERRNRDVIDKVLTSGPARLAQALGLNQKMDRSSLLSSSLWIEEGEREVKEKEIKSTTRVGVGYAKEYASKPWRFYIKDNSWVSCLKVGK